MMPSSPRNLRSCLDRGTRSTTNETDLHALRARTWLEHGVALLAIPDIADDEIVRRWGPRQQEKRHGEPPRFCRRLFGLSHAASAGCSSEA